MSDAVFGCFACIACVVIVLFNVGCFTPNWITLEETKMSNSTTVKNSTNATSTTTITRTCHHGLFYSIDCPESAKGKTIVLFAQEFFHPFSQRYQNIAL